MVYASLNTFKISVFCCFYIYKYYVKEHITSPVNSYIILFYSYLSICKERTFNLKSIRHSQYQNLLQPTQVFLFPFLIV